MIFLRNSYVFFGLPTMPIVIAITNRTPAMNPAIAFPIGLGEETFFRGFVQPSLTETLNPWCGIIASAVLFGASHIPNADLLESQERKD